MEEIDKKKEDKKGFEDELKKIEDKFDEKIKKKEIVKKQQDDLIDDNLSVYYRNIEENGELESYIKTRAKLEEVIKFLLEEENWFLNNSNEKKVRKRFQKVKNKVEEKVRDITKNINFNMEKIIALYDTKQTKNKQLSSIRNYIEKELLQELYGDILSTQKEKIELIDENLKERIQLEDKLQDIIKEIDQINSQKEEEISKLENQITSIDQKIQKLKDEVNKLGEEFRYKPESKENNNEQNQYISLYSCQYPKQPLPKVGKLYTYKGVNELAISTWEELDDAEKESVKYNATVVCEREL